MEYQPLSDEELRMLRMPTEPIAKSKLEPGTSLDKLAAPKQDQRLIDLHVAFASQLHQVLTELARRETVVRLRDEWVGMYAEFVFGQTIPTCCAVICSKLRDLEFYLAIDLNVLFPILDRLLGSRVTEAVPSRPLSDIERQITRILLTEVIARYSEMWQQTLSLDLHVDRIEHNAQQMAAIRGSEPTYHVRYDTSIDGSHGLVEFCLPWEKTKRLRDKLAGD